jgi:hypothetical protein
MKTKFHLGRGAAILACAASLAGTAAAVAPTAASARAASTCANKSIALKTEEGRTLHIPVKAISVEGGISCSDAYKLIAGALTGELPTGWKSAIGKFEAPLGFEPEVLKKGSKKIQFAVQGG